MVIYIWLLYNIVYCIILCIFIFFIMLPCFAKIKNRTVYIYLYISIYRYIYTNYDGIYILKDSIFDILIYWLILLILKNYRLKNDIYIWSFFVMADDNFTHTCSGTSFFADLCVYSGILRRARRRRSMCRRTCGWGGATRTLGGVEMPGPVMN